MAVQDPSPPASALVSKAALVRWTDPLLTHGMHHSLLIQTWVYIGLKAVVISTALFLLVLLLRSGRFWLFRIVAVPKGKILCPNAVDSLVFFAAIFYIGDAAFRGLTTRWWFGTFHPESNMYAWTALRLYPLWLAGFFHLCAICLIWPFSPHRLSPFWWHTFLFGVPISFLAAYLPPVIISNRIYGEATRSWEPYRAQLFSNPIGQVSTEEADAASELHRLIIKSAYYIQIWAAIGCFFLFTVLFMTLLVGIKLLSRCYAELRARRSAAAHGSYSIAAYSRHPSSVPSNAATTKKRRSINRKSMLRVKLTTSSLLKYIVGIKPLVESEASDEASTLPPSSAAVTALLASYVKHTTIQFICLLGLELCMLCVIILFLAQLRNAVIANTIVEGYGSTYTFLLYKYHLIEIWAVIVFGTPLVILMMFRQIYPFKVDAPSAMRSSISSSFSNRVGNGQASFHDRRPSDGTGSTAPAHKSDAHSTPGSDHLPSPSLKASDTDHNCSDSATPSVGKRQRDVTRSDGQTGPHQAPLHTPSRSADFKSLGIASPTSIFIPTKSKTTSETQEVLLSSRHQLPVEEGIVVGEGERGVGPSTPTSGYSDTPSLGAGEEGTTSRPYRDLGWFVTHGPARSVVLDALESGSSYRTQRRKRAPWFKEDVESHRPRTASSLYATPHGPVEATPLSTLSSSHQQRPKSSRSNMA